MSIIISNSVFELRTLPLNLLLLWLLRSCSDWMCFCWFSFFLFFFSPVFVSFVQVRWYQDLGPRPHANTTQMNSLSYNPCNNKLCSAMTLTCSTWTRTSLFMLLSHLLTGSICKLAFKKWVKCPFFITTTRNFTSKPRCRVWHTVECKMNHHICIYSE